MNEDKGSKTQHGRLPPSELEDQLQPDPKDLNKIDLSFFHRPLEESVKKAYSHVKDRIKENPLDIAIFSGLSLIVGVNYLFNNYEQLIPSKPPSITRRGDHYKPPVKPSNTKPTIPREREKEDPFVGGLKKMFGVKNTPKRNLLFYGEIDSYTIRLENTVDSEFNILELSKIEGEPDIWTYIFYHKVDRVIYAKRVKDGITTVYESTVYDSTVGVDKIKKMVLGESTKAYKYFTEKAINKLIKEVQVQP